MPRSQHGFSLEERHVDRKLHLRCKERTGSRGMAAALSVSAERRSLARCGAKSTTTPRRFSCNAAGHVACGMGDRHTYPSGSGDEGLVHDNVAE